MAKKKRQKKQGSPLSFIFMAVFAYLAGFPIWIVLILGMIGFLLWQVQKAQQGSNKLPPLPPAEPEQTETDTQTARPTPQPVAQTYQEPLPKETPPPWTETDYQPYPKAPAPTPPLSVPSPQPQAAQRAGISTGAAGAYRSGSRAHPLARNLRTRSGARQAIIAMTVLGPPRSLQPYELDPIQQGDIAPPRSS